MLRPSGGSVERHHQGLQDNLILLQLNEGALYPNLICYLGGVFAGYALSFFIYLCGVVNRFNIKELTSKLSDSSAPHPFACGSDEVCYCEESPDCIKKQQD